MRSYFAVGMPNAWAPLPRDAAPPRWQNGNGMRARAWRRELAHTLRHEAGRCTALIFTLALVACVARAGARYFYCPFMNSVAAAHCCAQDRPGQSSAVHPVDCCEVRTIGKLASASAGAPPSGVPAAPVVCVLAARERGATAPTPAGRLVMASGLSPPPARRSAQQIVRRT